MSSYLHKAVNPQTKKEQVCFAIDDYYGTHRYGYFFSKDGTDADWEDFDKLQASEEAFDIFDEEEME